MFLTILLLIFKKFHGIIQRKNFLTTKKSKHKIGCCQNKTHTTYFPIQKSVLILKNNIITNYG